MQGGSAQGVPASVAPATPPWQAPAAYVAGGILIVAGVVVLGLSRGLGLGRLRLAGISLSRATAGALGFSLLVLGYHVAVWLTPLRGLTIHVPGDLWWVVVGGAAAAVGVSALVDRMEGG